MDSNISFLLFGFRGLISNFQSEITFICSLSLFTFPKECNLLPRICYFLSLLVCSYFKIKLARFKYCNYVCFFVLWALNNITNTLLRLKSHYFFIIIVMLLQAPEIAFAVLFQFCPKNNQTCQSVCFQRYLVQPVHICFCIANCTKTLSPSFAITYVLIINVVLKLFSLLSIEKLRQTEKLTQNTLCCVFIFIFDGLFNSLKVVSDLGNAKFHWTRFCPSPHL